MRGRGGFLAVTVCATLALGATPAMAAHHEVKISEVYPGHSGAPQIEYVILEMVAPGQNLFLGSNASLTLHAGGGEVDETVLLNANLANGERGRRVLVATNDVETDFPGSNDSDDFLIATPPSVRALGGAVCFRAPAFGTGDCVSWGDFTGAVTPLPFPTGGNAPALTAASDGLVLRRSRPPCGPGLIDTNRPSDFTLTLPTPLNNAAAPASFTPCPQTTITKKPRKRTTKRRAVFKFKAIPAASSFECKLDKKPFKPCASPFRKRVKPGKHKFKVLAEDEVAPERYSWKVVAD